jgi:hypothetical protein
MKTFLSAQDIQAMADHGKTEVHLDENTILTDLARDEARRLGIQLVTGGSAPQSKRQVRPTAAPARPLGAKPKGCQHGGRPPSRAGTASARGTDTMVSELVDLVKKL